MIDTRVSGVAAWIIAAAVSISVAAFGIYINSEPIISMSCARWSESSGGTCVCPATEEFCLWGVIQKNNWALSAIYLIFALTAIFAVALIVERFLVFYNAGRQSREFQSKAGEAMFQGETKRAVWLARNYPDSPLAFVINATFADQADGGQPKPLMRFRHQAIVARTIELKRGLWQISATGWLLALLALLTFCVNAINVGQMSTYAELYSGPYVAVALIKSLSLIVYCVLAGFVVLGAQKFFAARVEHFQLEMDRLSLAFIEGVASTTESHAENPREYEYCRTVESQPQSIPSPTSKIAMLVTRPLHN